MAFNSDSFFKHFIGDVKKKTYRKLQKYWRREKNRLNNVEKGRETIKLISEKGRETIKLIAEKGRETN